MNGHAEIHFTVTVKKFKDDEAHKLNMPYQVLLSRHSDLLDEGADELIKLICGIAGATAWSDTAYLGVGDSSAVFDPTHTDLQGANKTYFAVDGAPTLEAGQKGRWVGTATGAVANHAWEEFTVSNTLDGTGKNLMRILADKGTKAEGETWELTVDEEFS